MFSILKVSEIDPSGGVCIFQRYPKKNSLNYQSSLIGNIFPGFFCFRLPLLNHKVSVAYVKKSRYAAQVPFYCYLLQKVVRYYGHIVGSQYFNEIPISVTVFAPKFY